MVINSYQRLFIKLLVINGYQHSKKCYNKRMQFVAVFAMLTAQLTGLDASKYIYRLRRIGNHIYGRKYRSSIVLPFDSPYAAEVTFRLQLSGRGH